MLIVNSNSTCDICTESFMEGTGFPHAIPCGHIFCRACLDQMQPQCPICRDEFTPWDIRRLHVDNDDSSLATVPPQVDAQAQRLLDDIAKAADEHAAIEEMQKLIDRCDAYHSSRLGSRPHTPLGVSHLLLSNLLEAQRKISELASARDDIRDHLTMELEAARLRYQGATRTKIH